MVHLRKEATELTLPRMVGEGIYGVGPILVALLSGRREFYGLYIQKGLDLSGNNRKKKDKKGFERVLTMVDKVGLRKIEVYKHELNMITDNRPYQELVLDASPLKMVVIKELEPVSTEEQEITSLWLFWMRLQILKIWWVLGCSVSSRVVPLPEIVPVAPTILVLGSE
ncbi:hypothetical protein BC332_07464 [Capsicum chinense]|nr:hypothetical protein BC332_07464 [Capsicum chinense]